MDASVAPRDGLVRGISWSEDGPALSLLTSDAGDVALPLLAGTWLRFEVLTGEAVPARFCLGYVSVQGPEESVHHRCPTAQAAERGFQCGACFARDEMRYMHDFHRSGIAPTGMRAYLAQPHWLYIATFADGTTKVGTASQRSKWRRLAEQGAVVAQYVALAQDGTVVRRLEDAVTQALGVSQFVRAATKLNALLAPWTPTALQKRNQEVAEVVRQFLAEQMLSGFEVVTERWQGSAFTHAITGAAARVAYPQPLDRGQHGMLVESMTGPFALVTLDGADLAFVADLGALKGRKIHFGDYATAVPALQESLF